MQPCALSAHTSDFLAPDFGCQLAAGIKND
jgi:hypothetical protein